MNWAMITLALMVVSIAAIVVGTTWIRARHGYPLENADGITSLKQSELEAENKKLKNQIGQLLDRVAVLEQIATDPAERTAREIEGLRDLSDVVEREKR